ncbi:MAG TPA: AraC family transcriptional regulator [Rhodanobacteraceae bacterium]|nr:AraC family transcriptional regulator [Rhodanobacteraceae bacterium]
MDGFKVGLLRGRTVVPAWLGDVFLPDCAAPNPMQEKMLHRFSGALVRRTIDRSDALVPEHAHDWPLLSLFVIGAYSNRTEIGEQFIAGPSAVFYAAGAAHRNTAGPDGFEQIEIEFDPAWLRSANLPNYPVMRWAGGRVGAEAHALAMLCSREASEKSLLAALRLFLSSASVDAPTKRPDWLGRVICLLREDPARKISELARTVGLHPSWLGAAYRGAAGEGLMETAARFRVEHAAKSLRETNSSLAEIAIEAGFCDQSHMIRTFHRILARLPSAVRKDQALFRQEPEVNSGT